MNRARCLKLVAGLALVLALVATYWFLHESDALQILLDGAQLRERITRLGTWDRWRWWR